MVNHLDPVTRLALVTLVSVLIGTCLLIAVAIFRRRQQTRYLRYVRSLESNYRPILATMLSGRPAAQGIDALRRLPLADLELLFDPLFSVGGVGHKHVAVLQALCAELGLIRLWQSRLTAGEEPKARRGSAHGTALRHTAPSLPRAKSIRNLGVLRHQPSWPLLFRHLDDPHADIQSVALRALATIGAPASFPALVGRLHAVVLGKFASPSPRALKTALASFDVTCSTALLSSLRDPHRRIRSLATNVLLVMVCREAALDPNFLLRPGICSPGIIEILLTNLWRDPSAEVRGRAAEVIAFLADPRATNVLHKLLFDPQWYVRLRAARALAGPRHSAPHLLLAIRDCLRDSHWRVREAAMQTLISLGRRGRQQLYEHFLVSRDQVTREQILEVIERSGLMASLVQEYGEGASGVEALIVEHFAGEPAPLGLFEVLRVSSPRVRQKFLERFLPVAHFKMQLQKETALEPGVGMDLQQDLEFPSVLVA
jgi:HEAT repeat protein